MQGMEEKIQGAFMAGCMRRISIIWSSGICRSFWKAWERRSSFPGMKMILPRNTRGSRLQIVKKADLFVSIHCGCGREDVGMPGMECYYAGDGSLGMEYADALAEALRQEASIKCSGAGRGDFYVLKNADMPAVLVKLGSLYDPDDRRKLEEASYREQVSRKLAESIMQLFYK